MQSTLSPETTPKWAEALRTLTPEAFAALRTEAARHVAELGCQRYRPYPKQAEFHRLGLRHRERLLRAGNQLGKTFCCAAEVAMHLTGRYPPGWPGRKWDRPIVVWAASDTAESARDNPQRALIGLPGEDGTGMIPAKDLCIGDGGRPADYGLASGTADLYDYVRVRHISGGTSMLRIKYYAQGRRKWQGPPVDLVWCDEEPDAPIYDEGLARTVATGGMLMLSCTPLLGMSEVMRRYLVPPITAERVNVQVEIEEAEHIAAEDRQRIVDSYPEHEREARARGVPVQGSGLIFPVARGDIEVQPFQVPTDWKQIVGIDFGYEHPTAFAKLAYDAENDCVYVTQVYRKSREPVPVHASALKALTQGWIPVAWPRDGLNETAAGPQLAKQYRDEGVTTMTLEHATFAATHAQDMGYASLTSVEAGVTEMLTRMQTGRWKVFSTCDAWFDEAAMYHRQNGQILKEIDDTLCASRYAYMMLRHAVSRPISGTIDHYRRQNWRVA